MNPIILAAITGLVVAILLTPSVCKLAIKLGVVAQPGGRRVHSRPTPMLGGLAMYAGFIVSVALVIAYDAYYYHSGLLQALDHQSIGILIGGTFMALIGVIDDKVELKGWMQALSIVIGGAILVIAGVKVLFITNPFKGGSTVSLGLLGIPMTIIWVLMVTKAVDCMDGLDGLAAGISAIASLTLMAMAISAGPRFKLSAVMASALFGAALGFLRYNYPPAKLFMGTVGAQFLGFMLAAISISGAFKIATLVAVAAPVFLMGVPLFDTSFVVIRRILTGKKIHEADTSHLHHRLVGKGLSHRQVIWVIYALTLTTCVFAYWLFSHAK